MCFTNQCRGRSILFVASGEHIYFWIPVFRMKDHGTEFTCRAGTSVVESSVCEHSTAYTGTIGQADKIGFSTSGAVNGLSQSGSINIIFHIDRNLKSRFHDLTYRRTGISGNVLIGIYNTSVHRIYLSGRADTNGRKIILSFIRKNHFLCGLHDMCTAQRGLSSCFTNIA